MMCMCFQWLLMFLKGPLSILYSCFWVRPREGAVALPRNPFQSIHVGVAHMFVVPLTYVLCGVRGANTVREPVTGQELLGQLGKAFQKLS